MFPHPAGLKCSAQTAARRLFLLAFALFLCVLPVSADFSQALDPLGFTYSFRKKKRGKIARTDPVEQIWKVLLVFNP